MRWQCEKYCRKYKDYLVVLDGVNVHQTAVMVNMKRRVRECDATLKFSRQPSTREWKLITIVEHSTTCFSGDTKKGGSSGVQPQTSRKDSVWFCD